MAGGGELIASTWPRRARRLAIRLAIAVTVFAVTAEVLVRVFDPAGVTYFDEAERYGARLVRHEGFAYLHRPGDRFRLGGVDVRTNSLGLRGSEPPARDPSRRRLLVLGDSVVFGWGVEESERFTSLLADSLAPEMDVVAAGAGSWNTRCEREWLRREGLRALTPDVVLLVAATNDAIPQLDAAHDVPLERLQAHVDRPSRLRARLHRHSWAARTALLAASQRRGLAAVERSLAPDSAAAQDARRALEALVGDVRAAGARVLVLLYVDPAARERAAFVRAYREPLESLDVDVVETPAALFDRSLRVSAADRHANAAGQAVLAEFLESWLRARLRSHS